MYEDFLAWLRSDRDIMGFMERMNGGGQHRAYLRDDDDSGGEVASDDCDSDLDEEREEGVGVGGVGSGNGNGGGRVGGRAAESDDDTSRVMELAAMAAATGGDEFMAVKPWIGAIKVREREKEREGEKERERGRERKREGEKERKRERGRERDSYHYI